MSLLDTSSSEYPARPALPAYPGLLTCPDLIRRNKRQSAVLMVFMIVLGVAIGAGAGVALGPPLGRACGVGGASEIAHAVVEGSSGQQPGALPSAFDGDGRERRPDTARFRAAGVASVLTWARQGVMPYALVGAGMALVLTLIGSGWAWFGGGKAILTMSGARPLVEREDPELFTIADEIRLAAGLPMPRLYVIDDSALNAFATGRSPRQAAVAITEGLRGRLTRDELRAVVAHEVAHIRYYDIRFAMLMATMVGLIAFACDGCRRLAYHGGHATKRNSDASKAHGGVAVALFLVAAVLAVAAPVLARIIQMVYSRRREYLADAGAVELTRDPLPLASALRKIADDPEPLVEVANRGTAHLFIVNPLRSMRDAHQSIDSVFFSHPPVEKRVARLEALAR